MLTNKDNQINKDHISKALFYTCDLLRGIIRPEEYKSYFFSLFMFKAISDTYKDAYCGENENYSELIEKAFYKESLVVPEGSSFYDVLETCHRSATYSSNYNFSDTSAHIDDALHNIEQANPVKFENAFQNVSFDTSRLGPTKKRNELLCKLLKMFNSLNLSVLNSTNSNSVGDAFEYAIQFFSENDGKSGAEYYTKPELSILLASLLEPVENDVIGDPFCGTGSLLIKCASLIRQKSSSRNYKLYGQEINSSTAALAKMNMFLHGEQNYNLELGHTLSNPKLVENQNELMRFDVIASHPPLSVKKYGYEELLYDTYNRFKWGMPPKTRGDYAFISHMVKSLKPETGRMAVIVPHGVLFRGTKEKEIRQNLIKDNLLDAVIGLPTNLFFTSSIPSAILIFKKCKADDNILFIDASEEYENRGPKSTLTKDHIDRIIATYKSRQSVDRYAYLATYDEIEDNSFNLNIPRYVDTSEPEEMIDINVVSNEQAKLMNELNTLSTEINHYFNNLGF